MRDFRPLLVLLLLVVIGGGALYLRGGNSNDTTSSSPSVTAPRTVNTIANPMGPTGEPDASANEFAAVIKRVTATENALFQAPDPNRVDEIMTTDCACNSDTRKRLSDLATKNWHTQGDSLKLVKTIYIKGQGAEMQGYVQLSPGGPIVDANGKTVEPAASGDVQPLVYTLDRGQDGIWRIADRRLPQEVVKQ